MTLWKPKGSGLASLNGKRREKLVHLEFYIYAEYVLKLKMTYISFKY